MKGGVCGRAGGRAGRHLGVGADGLGHAREAVALQQRCELPLDLWDSVRPLVREACVHLRARGHFSRAHLGTGWLSRARLLVLG